MIEGNACGQICLAVFGASIPFVVERNPKTRKGSAIVNGSTSNTNIGSLLFKPKTTNRSSTICKKSTMESTTKYLYDNEELRFFLIESVASKNNSKLVISAIEANMAVKICILQFYLS